MKPALILLLSFSIAAFSQGNKSPYRLPGGAKAGDYSSSTVMVKVKESQVGALRSGTLKAKTLNGTATFQARQLLPGKAIEKMRTRNAPFASRSGVAIERYAEIPVQGNNVESFINQLYATGLFELVEPSWRQTVHLAPNDPQAASQYYLNIIRAQEAWDIADGEGIVIGIVDSGGDLDHPDIAPKLFIDPAEPLDGIDNDGDGYIDNNRGWDFVGGDTLNINDPNFPGDNNPGNPTGGTGSHGTSVAGCAGAAVNNGNGIAGVGYKAMLMFTKHSADNQKTNRGSIYFGYAGLLYAASHGASVVNLSWGGPFRSQIQQDLIDYVALDLDCLVVASAGNGGTEEATYPGSYDHVLSVAATTSSDQKAAFSSYGATIDLSAPGASIITTAFDNSYTSLNGTSFSSPIVAGAAALVRQKFPAMTAIEAAEQIRVTADETFYSVNGTLLNRLLGKGRLDMVRALTTSLPSVRASNPKLVNSSGASAEPGQDGFLSLDFTNILASTTSALKVTIKPTVPGLITLIKPSVNPGKIESGKRFNNKLNPFVFKISNSVPTNTKLTLLITYEDGAYNDYEYVTFLLNPTYIDIDENEIITTVASNGRIGYENPNNSTNGVGFNFGENSLLYEMGIIAGTSSTNLYNNVRTVSGFDQDFTIIDKIREITPGARSSSETYGSFKNNTDPSAISVSYRSLAWNDVPYDKFVIMEYKVKNISANPLNGFNFALFGDWDITDNGQQDIAKWDPQTRMGYIYPAVENTKPHAGIRVLKGITPIHYAIDNNQDTPGVPFGLYDGFNDTEKFTAISGGIGRAEAGTTGSTGADVSHVVGAGPYNIAAGEEITIAFALLAATNLEDLKAASAQADTVYNFVLQVPRPVAQDVVACYDATATLTASGAGKFKWYREFTGGAAVAEGSTLTTGVIRNDTVLYVSNADNDYESVRTPVKITVSANPQVFGSGPSTFCEGGSVTLSAGQAGSYLWSTGATTSSITISTPGSYTVQVSDASLGCSQSSEPFVVTVNPKPTAGISIDTQEFFNNKEIQFTSTGAGATSYLWNFGDNATSTQQNPKHSYASISLYTITLQVTNEFGCQATTTKQISVVTGIEDRPETISVFPNPAMGRCTIDAREAIQEVIITGSDGRILSTIPGQGRRNLEVSLGQTPPGMVLLRIRTASDIQVRKLMIGGTPGQ